MSEATAQLLPMIAALSPEERLEVANYIQSLDTNDNGPPLSREEWQVAWLKECEWRSKQLASNPSAVITHDELMRELQEKYG